MTQKTTRAGEVSLPNSGQGLRLRAEQEIREKLESSSQDRSSALSPDDIRQVLHELQVHQIELEMQNEELRRIQTDLETSWARYLDLYDFAPVGYFTLDKHSLIQHANFLAAELLGVARSALIGQRLVRFIDPRDQDIYYRYQQNLASTDKPQVVQLRMTRNGGADPFWATMSAALVSDMDGKAARLVVVSDITETLQAETALRNSEQALRAQSQRLAEIIWATHVGTWEWNVQTGETAFNERWAEIVGYSLEELAPISINTWARLAHPDDLQVSEQLLKRCFNREAETYEFESRMRHRNGDWVWVLDRGRVVEWDADGKPLRMSGAHQDITDRKRAEERIRESESRFRSLADNAPVLIWMSEPDKRNSYFNKGWLNFTGRTPEQEFGDGWEAGVHPDDSPHRRESYDTAFDARRPFSMDYRLRRYDGVYRWMTEHAEPRFDAEGIFLGYIGSCLDITDRKETEASLLQYAEIIESSNDAIIAKSLDGVVTSWNRGAEQLFGYRRDEIVGKSITTLIPGEYLNDERLILDQIRRGQRMEHYETVRRHRSGRLITISVSASPLLDAVGTIVGASSISRDITARKLEDAIAAKAARYARSLIEASLDPLVTISADGKILDVNRATEVVTGCSREILIGSDFSDYFTDPEQARSGYRKAFDEGSVTDYPLAIRHESGRVIDVLYNASVYCNEAGEVEGVFAAARDVTERNQYEARLQLAASVFSHAREGITITDAAGNIIDVNDTFCRITGYSREEVLGQNPRLLKSGCQSPEYYAGMWHALLTQGHWDGEIWNRRKSGEVYAELLTISAVRDDRGETQHYVALFSDITPFKDHQKELERIAHYDTLTNLPNRLLLADRLQQMIAQTLRRGCSLAVIYLDLDGFKGVNDQYGHNFGDELLIAVAQRMTAALREGDTLARLGGDEFVVLMVDLERPQDCVPFLERLLIAAASPVKVGTAVMQVSASIGVTIYPRDGGDADQLLRHADQAMYIAKQSGKNRYHLFDTAEDAAARTHLESLARIRLAMDQQEFVLFYQPKVNMKTGALIGAEALIRWQHPEQGLLRPAAFLPIIENHSFGIELGDWVIDTALAQVAAWHEQGMDIPVSVNVGARQLQRDEFIPHLRARLASYPHISPDHLELEILESSALEDMEHVSWVMQTCHDIGVRFSIDDFGTGYSSLTYLKRLPADMIKIDQSFVRDMLDDPEDLAIVEAVISLATTFSRKVIAEGVETAAHGDVLLPLGCELAQGYGIARPMPAAELPGWAKVWRPNTTWKTSPTGTAGREWLPILFAMTHHRAWVREIEACLASEVPIPPPSDQNHCLFGAWLKREGRARWGTHPGFQSIAETHRGVHALADELVALHASGGQTAARERLGELQHSRDALIAQLKALMHEPAFGES